MTALTSGPDHQAVAEAAETIRRGSKSFAAAARLFAPAMRDDAVLLYAWCRHCDDVIDGQDLGHGAIASAQSSEERLQGLRDETARALESRATDPVFVAFGALMRRRSIPAELAFDHLEGFAMDVEGRRYKTLGDVLSYCYGVAGVVGLMMAHVMGVTNRTVLQRACDLGLAFQLTNIARDIVDDARIGRVYLPEDWLREAGIPLDQLAEPQHRAALAGVARRLVSAAEPYYASAAVGITALPFRAAWAIATARGVYRAIGTEVVRRGPAAWDSRVSTTKADKLRHVLAGAVQAAGRGQSARVDRTGLWTLPAGRA